MPPSFGLGRRCSPQGERRKRTTPETNPLRNACTLASAQPVLFPKTVGRGLDRAEVSSCIGGSLDPSKTPGFSNIGLDKTEGETIARVKRAQAVHGAEYLKRTKAFSHKSKLYQSAQER